VVVTVADALRIVALDLSLTATGVAATHDHHGRPAIRCSTVHTARTRHGQTDMDHQRVDQVLADVAVTCGWVGGQFTAARPHLVVVEWLPLYGAKGDATLRLAELHGVVKHWLHSKRIPYRDVRPVQLKIWATGSGSTRGDDAVSKVGVREAVTATYGGVCHVADSDQADALALLSLACAAYGQPLAPVGSQNRRALSSVAWPALATESGPVVPVVGAAVSGGAGGKARRPARTPRVRAGAR
jgi:crossover junction endodeoxyribonuclease RuvC